MKLASNRHCEACGPNTSSGYASASSSRVGAALSHRSFPNDKARCKNDTTQGRTRERTTTRHRQRQRHRHRCVLSPPSRLPRALSAGATALSFFLSVSLVTFAAHACRSSRGRLARLLLLPTSLPPPPELAVSLRCVRSLLGGHSLCTLCCCLPSTRTRAASALRRVRLQILCCKSKSRSLYE